MRRALLAALVVMTPAAPAQAGGLPFDPAVLTTCLAEGQGLGCYGRGAEHCTLTSPGGGSNIGWTMCYDAERAWWDAELNDAYQRRMAEARRIDAEPTLPGMRPRPSDVEALRTMQRAWIAFRDATCTFEELQWWGGTGASGAHVECLGRLTAAQTLYLRNQLGG